MKPLFLAALFGGWAAASQPAAPPAKFIYAFDGPASISALRVTGATAEWARTTEDGAKIEGTAEQLPAIQTGAVHLVLQPGKTYPTVEFDSASGLASDWSGHDMLVFHFDNGSEFLIPITLTVTDGAGRKFVAGNLRLIRSRNRLEIPLAELRTAEGKPLNLGQIRKMRMEIRSAEKFQRDLWLYHFYVAGTATTSTTPELLFDFGPHGAPVFAGAKPVDEATAYAAWRGYGWTGNTRGFESWYFNRTKPDPLLCDFVWADLGSATATLRVDLPDGRYRARFYGGNYTVKALAMREFELAVNGRRVAERKADPAAYYTSAEYFRGIDDWYEPTEDVWAKRAADLYQHYDFVFTAASGKAEFTWSKTLAAFGLLIAPEKGFDSAVARLNAARRKYFEANLVPPRPRTAEPQAGPADKQRGFLVWSRTWARAVGPYDLPAAGERNAGTLHVVAARNQRAHVTVTVTPLGPLGFVEAAVSELKNQSGAVLPANAVQVRALRYLWDDWPAHLGLQILFPTRRVPSRGNVNVTFWLTAAPPAGATPGVYQGTLRLSPRWGGSALVPLEVSVLPFSLAEDYPVAISLYRQSDYNMSYSLRHFLPGKMDYFRRLLLAEAASLKAHGMSAFHFTAPIIKGVQGGHVVLDFRLLEEECRAVKECRLYEKERPGYMFLLVDVARNLMKETRHGDFQEPDELSAPLSESERVEEFSDLFNQRFLDAARQLQSFFDKQGIPVLMYLADEPRERNINQWNRNLADSIRYSDLIHAALPNVRTFIDPMRDSNSGVDYTPLLDHFDVVATHPWDQSARIYERTRDGKPALQYDNAIVGDRYDYGFQVAASHSTGFAQWHFQWILLPFQPFHGTNRWGMTLPGPDGPLDTPAYESIAAGIDDYRYVATLRSRVAQANKAGKRGSAVQAAEAALKELLANTEPYAMRKEYEPRQRPRTSIAGRSLDEWRMILATHIQAIDRLEP